MRLGFVVERRAQEIELHVSEPEKNHQSALVTYSRVGDSFALLMGQLFYRSDRLAELLALCSPDALRECQVNDAALALATYRHLGLAALERLEGDFALVIWDAQTTQLIGMRDPLSLRDCTREFSRGFSEGAVPPGLHARTAQVAVYAERVVTGSREGNSD